MIKVMIAIMILGTSASVISLHFSFESKTSEMGIVERKGNVLKGRYILIDRMYRHGNTRLVDAEIDLQLTGE